MAVTSKSARRVNGHFVDTPDVGTHCTEKQTVGVFSTAEEAAQATARVNRATEHYRAKMRPLEHELHRLYLLQAAETERAAITADWEPSE